MIIITNHARQRFSERLPFVPMGAIGAITARAFNSAKNSLNKTEYGSFLRYYAEKYSEEEQFFVTDYNGYLFIFSLRKNTLITVIDETEGKAFKAYLKYKFGLRAK